MKRYIAAILIPCLLLQFTGCVSTNYLTKNEFIRGKYDDAKILTRDSTIYYTKNKTYTINNDTLFIYNKSPYTAINTNATVPLDDIMYFEVNEVNQGATIALVLVSAAIIGLMIFLYVLENDLSNALGE